MHTQPGLLSVPLDNLEPQVRRLCSALEIAPPGLLLLLSRLAPSSLAALLDTPSASLTAQVRVRCACLCVCWAPDSKYVAAHGALVDGLALSMPRPAAALCILCCDSGSRRLCLAGGVTPPPLPPRSWQSVWLVPRHLRPPLPRHRSAVSASSSSAACLCMVLHLENIVAVK